MKLLKLHELVGHDVYEFCYPSNYPKNWNEDSLYIDSDDIVILQPYFEQVFSQFSYYGQQKIMLFEWKNIEELCLLEKPKYKNFFNQINDWIRCDPMKSNFLWLLGV